jgi:hypothetical protein
MADTSQLVSDYFSANPNATAQDVANAVQSIGGLTPDLSSAIAQHYGTDTSTINNAYTQLTAPLSAPAVKKPVVAPLGGNAVSDSGMTGGSLSVGANAPFQGGLNKQDVSPAPAPYSSALAPATANDTNNAFNQTYNAIQYGNTKIGTIDVPDQETGSTSQRTALLDANGNPLPADNVVSVGNGIYDLQVGSAGGTIHTYVRQDPTTGNIQPIQDYTKQISYQGGQKGGFVNQTASALSQIPFLNVATAMVAPEALPYLSGLNAVNAVNKGNIPGAVLGLLGASNALPADLLPVDKSTLKTATNVASGVNAIVNKNPLALANAVLNGTDTKLPSEIGTGAQLASAYLSLQKGDGAGLINTMMGLVKSQDPKVSSTAQKVVDAIQNGADPSIIKTSLDDLSSQVSTNQPVDLKSTGLSDSPAGTIFTQPDGTKDIVLAGGQTVKLSDYQNALQSGSAFSVDGISQVKLSPTELQAKIDEKDPNVKYLGKNEDGEDEYTYDDPETKLRSSYVDGQYVGSIKLGDTGEVPITGGVPATPLQPTGQTTEPQTITDPKTGISTTEETIDGEKVTTITDPNAKKTQQTTESADGTKKVVVSDIANGTKTISTYDQDGHLTDTKTTKLNETGDDTVPTITITDKKITDNIPYTLPPKIIVGQKPPVVLPEVPPVVPPVVPPEPQIPPVEPPPNPPVEPPPTPPTPPVVVKPPVVDTPTTTVSIPSTSLPTTKTPTTSGGAPSVNMPTNFGGHTPNPIVESLLKTYMTQQAFKDPLANLEKLVKEEQQSEKPMIDPRLAQILQERSAPQQTNYYNYGQEPQSVEDVLALRDNAGQYYKTGGHVQPLAHASGGALPVVNNRHDFRHGAHVAGEGDGTSDDIPAMLADGEFVFPADVVSALGNGSTKAGTDKLYEMMHAIRARARKAHPSDLPPDALKSPLDYLKGRKK